MSLIQLSECDIDIVKNTFYIRVRSLTLCLGSIGWAPGSDPINTQHSLGPLAPEFLMAGPGVCCCLCLAGVKCFISQSNWNIIWTEQDNWYFKWFHSTNHKKDIAVANRYIIHKKNAQSKKIEGKNNNIYTPPKKSTGFPNRLPETGIEFLCRHNVICTFCQDIKP